MIEAVALVLQVNPTDDLGTAATCSANSVVLVSQDTEKSQNLSRLAFYTSLHSTFPFEFQIISTYFNRTEIQMGRQEALGDHTGLTEETMLSLAFLSARNILTIAKTLARNRAKIFTASSPTSRALSNMQHEC